MSSPPLATLTLVTADSAFAQKPYPAQWWTPRHMLPLALSIAIIAAASLAATHLQRRKAKPLFIADHAHPDEHEGEEEEEDYSAPTPAFHTAQIELRNLQLGTASYPVSGFRAGMTDVEILAPAPAAPPPSSSMRYTGHGPARNVVDSRFGRAEGAVVVTCDLFSDSMDPFADPGGSSSSRRQQQQQQRRGGETWDAREDDDDDDDDDDDGSTFVQHPGSRWRRPVRLELGSEYEGSYRASTLYGRDIDGDPF
ncbi:hypothetical protein K505DRAFT_327953 [Melanomma pulvis-pyrius CBS 109.77]|uniref:Uncharacterized protein n=1 Tax=Melanomma pulvis-pyrius CBS 109.77 TaxID=1314802 RepID=A0A6A6X104_9PLEO|nr:hypothetical protein K505DRAFT_327953 [Melanomma pulvis-pyrius CBS 109.77]